MGKIVLVGFLNVLVDGLLLWGANRLTGYPLNGRRCILAALAGGLYAGVCFLGSLAFLGGVFWHGIMMGAMAVTAYGWSKHGAQQGAMFLLLNMAVTGLANVVGKSDLWIPVICTCGMAAVCVFGVHHSGTGKLIPVELEWQGKRLRILALEDTGNLLKDPVTGEPVMVAGADVGQELLGILPKQLQNPVDTVASGAAVGARLIPYHTVGKQSGMLLAFRFPDAKVDGRAASPLVAFAPEVLASGKAYRMLTGGTV